MERRALRQGTITPPAFTRRSNVKLPTVSDIHAERMRRRFAVFVKAAWEIVEPATPLVWNWHMDALCDHVQALVQRKLTKNNLLMNVPPGTSKSTIVSVCLLPWIWTWNPAYRAVFASGNPRVSSRDSVKRRMIMESDWYRSTFDIQWNFRRDQNEKLSYSNTATGVCLATTTNAKVTGERYNGLFVDDAIDATEAFQQVEVDKANSWWDQSFYNRVNDERTGTRCIIGQRLREDDLPGHVLERDTLLRWEWVCIPQEWGQEEEDTRRTTELGWTDPRHYYQTTDPAKPTETTVSYAFTEPTLGPNFRYEYKDPVPLEHGLMFIARFTQDSLLVARLILGQSGYEGQHQQRPSMLKGEIFQRGHATFIPRSSIPVATIVQIILSLDSAIKTAEENDYSVILEGWEFDRGIFINSCVQEKWRYTQLKEAVTLKAVEVNPSALLIEDKSSGQNLIQEYQNDGKFPVVPIMPLIDKVARARPLTPYWEANRVFFPCDEHGQPEAWVAAFLTQLYNFPKAKHDDMVDAFTQMLQFLFLAPGARGLIDFYNAARAKDDAIAAAQRKEEEKHHPVHHHYLGGATPNGHS